MLFSFAVRVSIAEDTDVLFARNPSSGAGGGQVRITSFEASAVKFGEEMDLRMAEPSSASECLGPDPTAAPATRTKISKETRKKDKKRLSEKRSSVDSAADALILEDVEERQGAAVDVEKRKTSSASRVDDEEMAGRKGKTSADVTQLKRRSKQLKKNASNAQNAEGGGEDAENLLDDDGDEV
jgi:hypothetical protein